MPAPTDELSLPADTVLWIIAPEGRQEPTAPGWRRFAGVAPSSSWRDAAEPGSLQAFDAAIAALAGTGRCAAVGLRARRADGVWRDLAGEALALGDGGVAVSLRDATDGAALAERESHLGLLDRIASETRALGDPVAIMATTARLLGEHLRAMRCAYADVEADNDRFTIRADWSRPGVASSAGGYSLALFGPQAVDNLNRGVPLVVDDVDRDLGDDGGGRMFNAIGIKAIVCASLVKGERLVALMAVHHDAPHAWSAAELALIGEVVDRCWAHIERVRDHAALLEQDRHKDEFLATLAHELRNPLAPMRYALALLRERTDQDTLSRTHGLLERQVTHMGRLVDDLLDVSRISRGLITLQLSQVDIGEVLSLAAEASAHLMSAAGHAFVATLPSAPLTVEADRARLVQMVANLLTNAAKYTPPGGRIALRASAARGRVRIEVEDDGIGVDPADQGRLFTMFTQLRSGLGRSQNGLGIGLALVRRLARMQGGDAAMHSPGLGRGSLFTIELPLCQVRAQAAPAAGAPAQVTATTQARKRVLVVEDNQDGREILVTLLQTLGFEARGAGDGPAALEAAAAFAPHVVLLDLGLPGMHGVDVGRALRAAPATADSRIVAVTGWGADRDRIETRRAGFDAHLTKPVDPDALARLIAVDWEVAAN